MKNKSNPTIKYLSKIQIGLIVIVLFSLGLLFFQIPINEVSEYEKRRLADFPEYATNHLISGKYTQDLEAYLSDHFTFRDFWVETAFQFKTFFGLKSEATIIKSTQESDNQIDTSELTQLLIDTSSTSIDSTRVQTQDSTFDQEEPIAEKTEGLLIWEGRAYQIFGGNNRMAKYFAKSLNKYHKAMGKLGVKFHSLVIPSPAAFYIPNKYQKMFSNERINLDEMYKHLDSGIANTDVYEILDDHKDEYLYFYTDHHWTGLAAYYAYMGFCKTAKITPTPIDSFKRKVIPNFLGSLYLQTKNQELKEHKDSVEYFKSKIKTKTTAWVKSIDDKPIRANVLYERAKRSAAYSVFLGSDYTLMKIETSVKNGKKIALIKNSFGNAFAPFLINHFETVFVIDYRYYDGNLTNLIKENNITDVVLLQNNFGANTSWHIKKTLRIINPPKKIVNQEPKDSVLQKIDSTKF